MFRHRVARNRVLYFSVLLLVLAGFAFLIDRKWEFYQLLLIVVVFLIPGRIVQLFWRDFFDGKKKLAMGDFEGAMISFGTFLERIREKRWLKWMMFFSYGLYSFKIEAVALTQMAVACLHKKDYEKAREYLKQSLQLDVRYSFAFYYEAVVDLLTGNKHKAEENFRRAQQNGYPRMTFDDFVEITFDHFSSEPRAQ